MKHVWHLHTWKQGHLLLTPFPRPVLFRRRHKTTCSITALGVNFLELCDSLFQCSHLTQAKGWEKRLDVTRKFLNQHRAIALLSLFHLQGWQLALRLCKGTVPEKLNEITLMQSLA